MSERPLTIGQRIFIWCWHRLTNALVGFSDPFTEEYVHTFGIREFFRWAKISFEVVQALEKRWGKAEAQWIIAFAALWSGCRWCSVGHLYTGNLELFKRSGQLGPVDEREVCALQSLRDPEVLDTVLECYSGSEWDEFRDLIRQQYLLRSGQVEEQSDDDNLLQMANYMWEWVNECSITVMDIDPEDIPAQSAINKDHELLERYRRARREQASNDG